MAGLRLSVFSSPMIQAAVLAVRAANKELQAEIRKYTKAELQPQWADVMRENASTQLEAYALADTARVSVSNQNVRLSTATVNAHLSGGLDVKTQAGAVEFGADREATSTFTQRSKRGKPYKVTRHTRRQFREVNRHGYVFYPSVAQMAPRFVSLWVQTAIRTLMDALDSAQKAKK